MIFVPPVTTTICRNELWSSMEDAGTRHDRTRQHSVVLLSANLLRPPRGTRLHTTGICPFQADPYLRFRARAFSMLTFARPSSVYLRYSTKKILDEAKEERDTLRLRNGYHRRNEGPFACIRLSRTSWSLGFWRRADIAGPFVKIGNKNSLTEPSPGFAADG